MSEHSIRRLLVANRGEIALRIMRTCHEMGIDTIAIYGEGEERSRHVQYATDAYRIAEGDGLAYLRQDAILAIARQSSADAIHPGYGFLAESGAFAQKIEDAGILWVGPPAHAIEAMGDKVAARKTAIAAGVMPVPGTDGPIATVEEARAWANEHGYPIAIKASAGGGGRGFRVARSEDDLVSAFEGATGEAQRYFSNPEVYLERYVDQPRHIEIQVFADRDGKVTAFPERECSIQRRHQKLVEETPSSAVDAVLRLKMMDAAVRLAEAVDYRNVGTIEFLLDKSGNFYFLEMNTRIQVEHTVTEEVTGYDIVREQILQVMGQPASFTTDRLQPNGHSIECRINAEDPSDNFRPSATTVDDIVWPIGFGVRVDSSLQQGDAVSPLYDSLISKVITWGRNREMATARMKRALHDYKVVGLPTTIPFHRRVLELPDFVSGNTTTDFLTRNHDALSTGYEPVPATDNGTDPEQTSPVEMLVEVASRRFDVKVHGMAAVAGATSNGKKSARRTRRADRKASGGGPTGDEVKAVSQGTVLRVAVEVGQTVSSGDLLFVIEAMKMENEITAHKDGVISSINVEAGQAIAAGTLLITIGDA